MKRYPVSFMFIGVIVAVALSVATIGIVYGKAHVPAEEVQVSHKGRTAINVDAPA